VATHHGQGVSGLGRDDEMGISISNSQISMEHARLYFGAGLQGFLNAGLCFAEFFLEVYDEREDLLRDGFGPLDCLRGNNERNRFICRCHGRLLSFGI
jgi:hypothetical protein